MTILVTVLTFAKWASSISRWDSVVLGSGLTVTAMTLEFTTVWFLNQTEMWENYKINYLNVSFCIYSRLEQYFTINMACETNGGEKSLTSHSPGEDQVKKPKEL